LKQEWKAERREQSSVYFGGIFTYKRLMI